MSIGSSAGVLSRRFGFGPAEWRARLRLLFARRGHRSLRGAFDPERIADAWVAEFGDAAAWNVERKLGELLEWGDRDGARVWAEVLNIIQERGCVGKPTGN